MVCGSQLGSKIRQYRLLSFLGKVTAGYDVFTRDQVNSKLHTHTCTRPRVRASACVCVRVCVYIYIYIFFFFFFYRRRAAQGQYTSLKSPLLVVP